MFQKLWTYRQSGRCDGRVGHADGRVSRTDWREGGAALSTYLVLALVHGSWDILLSTVWFALILHWCPGAGSWLRIRLTSCGLRWILGLDCARHCCFWCGSSLGEACSNCLPGNKILNKRKNIFKYFTCTLGIQADSFAQIQF
jgi:hypothetical protein